MKRDEPKASTDLHVPLEIYHPKEIAKEIADIFRKTIHN
jgi:hypothetical protein